MLYPSLELFYWTSFDVVAWDGTAVWGGKPNLCDSDHCDSSSSRIFLEIFAASLLFFLKFSHLPGVSVSKHSIRARGQLGLGPWETLLETGCKGKKGGRGLVIDKRTHTGLYGTGGISPCSIRPSCFSDGLSSGREETTITNSRMRTKIHNPVPHTRTYT